MQQYPKWLFSALIALWLMGCSHSPTAKVGQPANTAETATQAVPKAEVPNREFNFGVMDEDGTYVHDFKILNRGTGVLEINQVTAA